MFGNFTIKLNFKVIFKNKRKVYIPGLNWLKKLKIS